MCLNPETSPKKAFRGYNAPSHQVFGGLDSFPSHNEWGLDSAFCVSKIPTRSLATASGEKVRLQVMSTPVQETRLSLQWSTMRKSEKQIMYKRLSKCNTSPSYHINVDIYLWAVANSWKIVQASSVAPLNDSRSPFDGSMSRVPYIWPCTERLHFY